MSVRLSKLKEDSVSFSNAYYTLIPYVHCFSNSIALSHRTVMKGGYTSQYLLSNADVLEREFQRIQYLMKEDHSIQLEPLVPKFDPLIIPDNLRAKYNSLGCKVRELSDDDLMKKKITQVFSSLLRTSFQGSSFSVDRIFAISRDSEVS